MLATGESGPPTRVATAAPRLATARSTSWATAKASTTVAMAVITSRCADQNEASGGAGTQGRLCPRPDGSGVRCATMDPVPTSAVLLDSLGTLLRLEPPAPRLRAELQRMGRDVCEYNQELPKPRADYVPNHLPGTNPFLKEVAEWYALPAEVMRGGEETMYPEYRQKIGKPRSAKEKCDRYCSCGAQDNPTCSANPRSR